MSRRFASTLTLALALAACTVGPDYRRPQIEMPATWRGPVGEAPEAADLAWWEQFQDPVLSALVLEAVRSNKDLAIGTARVEQAYAQYGITRSALFPQADASASAARQRVSRNTAVAVPAGRESFNDFAAELSLSYEIDLWGRVRRATEAARADLLASEEGRRTVVMTLVSSVASGYVQLRALDRQLQIARQTSQSLGEAARLQRVRFEQGARPESDYQQAESQYQSAAAQVPELERLVARQESFISVLLGRNPGPIARGREIEALAFPAVPGALPSTLLERRPDLLQAEQNLVAANADIGVAKAAYFPRISLTAALGFESADLSDLLKSSSRRGAVGVGATLPIFNAGRIRNQVAQAEAFQREALASYEKSILVALQDVEDALTDRAKFGEARETQAKNVAALARFRDLAALRYREGATIYLEVANAEQSLFSAQLAYVATQAQLFQSYATLYKAVGGGWDAMIDPVAAKALQ
jgi:multidrug efflux system outer membrane protein